MCKASNEQETLAERPRGHSRPSDQVQMAGSSDPLPHKVLFIGPHTGTQEPWLLETWLLDGQPGTRESLGR